MTDKVTMATIWEELTAEERDVISKMMGVEIGQMALSKISTVLKAIMYRFHDKPIYDQTQAQNLTQQRQIEMLRQQYEHQLKQIEHEMNRRYEHEMQRTYTSNNTSTNEFERMRKMYGW